MHSEHLTVDNEKIAKSAGNSITLHTLYERGFSASDYRYWLLTAHYRTKINFSFEALEGSKQAYLKIKRLMYIEWAHEKGRPNVSYLQKFSQAINDDLNTPRAIALLWDIIKDDSLTAGEKRATIIDFDQVLGLSLDLDPEEGKKALGYLDATAIPEEIQELINAREVARIARNWPEADRIRATLEIKGYTLEDTAEGAKVTKL
jgi:cysteinyl-tRNA synthetase